MKSQGFKKFLAVTSDCGDRPTFVQQPQGFSLTSSFQTNPRQRRSQRRVRVR